MLVLVLALELCPGPYAPCAIDPPVRRLGSRGLGGGGRLCRPPLALGQTNPTIGLSGVEICSEPAVDGRRAFAAAAGDDCRLEVLERTDKLLVGAPPPPRSILGLDIDPFALAYAPSGLASIGTVIFVPVDPARCDRILCGPRMGDANAAESLGSRLVLVLLARNAAKPTGVPFGANPLIAGYSKLAPVDRARDKLLGGACSAPVCSLASSPSLSSSDGGIMCCLGPPAGRCSSALKLHTLILGLSRVEGDVSPSLPCFNSGGDTPGAVPLASVNGPAASRMNNPEMVRGELKCDAHSSSSMAG